MAANVQTAQADALDPRHAAYLAKFAAVLTARGYGHLVATDEAFARTLQCTAQLRELKKNASAELQPFIQSLADKAVAKMLAHKGV
ncbi:MAG: hypothetical protein ABIG68_05920 [Acidobacteriota bacterium]